MAFLVGLKKLGKGNWRGISRHFVPTRTPTQVASHAQKHFLRLQGVSKRKSRFSMLEQAACAQDGSLDAGSAAPGVKMTWGSFQPGASPPGRQYKLLAVKQTPNDKGSSFYPTHIAPVVYGSFPVASSAPPARLPLPPNRPAANQAEGAGGSAMPMGTLGQQLQYTKICRPKAQLATPPRSMEDVSEEIMKSLLNREPLKASLGSAFGDASTFSRGGSPDPSPLSSAPSSAFVSPASSPVVVKGSLSAVAMTSCAAMMAA
mmetsp:Transcript_58706/g.187265  ORF Transcript_58706/g.187265 Transcript_58706/m.187265 type:complete len:260 (+) Transcript_58706:983-1762(+)